ncbi:sulfite reductase subunit alpha [Limnoglobus roseus]|uniref:assimilatory sulfite reductase (NADPH) n=1 Tax=Limnoglobus roseus TaxID=2598579 RepID=A0A5C1AQN7_9BACT|nr:sulfite reductase subunit alpha [Limnoglobus roseus]QEL20363.1 sulfite reductase subunit alpha [Limnoglobus roseus]
MPAPLLPETAPFTSAQRSWLNGFFAGVFGLASSPAAPATPAAPPVVEEDFPWHDPNLKLDERMKLAEGKPPERQMMAAMAQLDCGACGYVCKTYSEAIANGEEKDLTKCSPGGKDTSKKLKEIVAGRKALPVAEANGHAKPAKAKPAVRKGVYDRHNPFPAPLLEARPLNATGSEKDVRYVAFSLRGSGLKYDVGDALGLIPENDPELVEAILKALGVRGDEVVTVADGQELHAFDALARHCVITKVSDDLAALLAGRATDPSEAATLKTLIEDDVEGIPATWDVLDILEQFSSARAPVADVVATLPTLQPRLYSISSSLKVYPEEVHLTVGVVRYTQGGRVRKGVASNFITETLRTRQKVGVFVHPSSGFRLPADGNVPVIMVGPGTGIAPFRAFLQERSISGAAGKNWLFFGDQRREYDFLYRDEMESYTNAGVLTRFDLAFSRDQEAKVYVQHKMLEAGEELWKWLEAGAHFYVCGDARRMALDVDHALHEVVRQHGKMSADAAKEYIKAMSKDKRYQRDVY